MSRYDDYLVEVAKRPGYKSGDILKLILPFLKAHGLTDAQIEAYSRKNVTLVPGAEGAFKFLHSRDFPIFAISTSYRPFAEAVGLKLGFKKERIFSTGLDLDRYSLSAAEAEELKRLQREIVAAPAIELPATPPRRIWPRWPRPSRCWTASFGNGCRPWSRRPLTGGQPHRRSREG